MFQRGRKVKEGRRWLMNLGVTTLGNVVRSQLLHSGTMSVSGLAPGIYYLRISNSEGDQRTARLVITDRQ